MEDLAFDYIYPAIIWLIYGLVVYIFMVVSYALIRLSTHLLQKAIKNQSNHFPAPTYFMLSYFFAVALAYSWIVVFKALENSPFPVEIANEIYSMNVWSYAITFTALFATRFSYLDMNTIIDVKPLFERRLNFHLFLACLLFFKFSSLYLFSYQHYIMPWAHNAGLILLTLGFLRWRNYTAHHDKVQTG